MFRCWTICITVAWLYFSCPLLFLVALYRFSVFLNNLSSFQLLIRFQQAETLEGAERKRSFSEILSECQDSNDPAIKIIKVKCLLGASQLQQCLKELEQIGKEGESRNKLHEIRTILSLQASTEGQTVESTEPKHPKINIEQRLGAAIRAVESSLLQETKTATPLFRPEASEPDNQRLLRLVEWLGASSQSNKVYLDSSQFGGSRCVRAAADIPKKSILIFVPKDKLITLELAKSSKVAQPLTEKHVQLHSPKHCILSVYLLEQKLLGEASAFKPYIDTLPIQFSTFPIFYHADQKKQLEGSYFQEQLQQKIQQITKDYRTVCEVCTSIEFSYQQFCWARMVVCSRIFGISIHGNRTDALVPLADMLNHNAHKQAIWYYNDLKEGFIMQASQDIVQGAQVFDSYGKKCNSRFLLNYGFALDQNQANEVVFKVETQRLVQSRPRLRRARNAEQQIQKRKLELTQVDTDAYFRVVKGLSDKSFKELLSTLRFRCICTNEELNILSQALKQLALQFKPCLTPFITTDVEKRSWECMARLCQDHLQEYPTSLKQDLELLAQGPSKLDLNIRNCVVLRKGEKQILEYYLKTARKLERLFGTSKREIKRHLAAPEYSAFSEYITTLPQL